jgi:hypothetical protein
MKTEISAEVIAHSFNIATNDELITFRIVCPKFILAEVTMHRMLSRSFSSSRAIPSKKMRRRVIQDPVIPVEFGKAKKGMQSDGSLTGLRLFLAKKAWMWARYPACFMHWLGETVGLHKQICNRLIEPWVWAEGVVSGTTFDNFYNLRCHKDAQPEFRDLAIKVRNAHNDSLPIPCLPGELHLPFVTNGEKQKYRYDLTALNEISSARCGRVSYYLRDGKLSTINEDHAFCNRLFGSDPKHVSPAEHPAMALATSEKSGNYTGWKQYRKEIE